jgi:TonB family protein
VNKVSIFILEKHMASKFKVFVFLIIAGLSYKVNAQTVKKKSDDSVRIAHGPKPIQLDPAFPGGVAGYSSFLKSSIHYPLAALNKKVQGMAFIQFIVEKDGTLSNIKLLKDPGEGLGEEAIRVIKLSPKWSVGMDNNVPVRVQMTVPVMFVLPKAPPVN